MNFTTNTVREGGYITPGIHEVTIGEIKGVSSNDKPRIDISFYLRGSDNAFSTTIRTYLSSEKSLIYGMRKIKHLATSIVQEEAIDNIEASSIEEYGDQVNSLLAGKDVRIKFIGEEYLNQNEEVKVRVNLGLPPFAEALVEGAKYPVAKQSSLKYDPTNRYDYKPLEQSQNQSIGESANSSTTSEGGWE